MQLTGKKMLDRFYLLQKTVSGIWKTTSMISLINASDIKENFPYIEKVYIKNVT